MNAPAFVSAPAIRADPFRQPEMRRRIEAFLDRRPDAELFHFPRWSEAVEAGCRQRAHLLVAERSDGEIVGLLPLSEIRSRLFGSALVSTGFGVGGGIVADDEPTGERLAEAAWELAGELGCPQLELRGGALPPEFDRDEATYAGFARELPSSEDAILKAIPRKQRAEVRRALGLGMDIDVGSGPRQREAHYRVYSESVRNLGTPVFPRSLFAAMLDSFGEGADILTVSKDDRPVASVLSFYFRGTVFPYWGGGTREARSLRANELLYFALMRHAAGRGCTRFDFGRSKVGSGAFAYKKNWGFEPKPLAYGIRTSDEANLRTINPMSPKYRMQVALWRRLPLLVTNRLGPLIARGLG